LRINCHAGGNHAEAVDQGVDCLRINPGNIGAKWKVEEVVKCASEKKIPIRIGVNAGSLDRAILDKFGGATAEAMVESGLNQIHVLEDLNYTEIKISLKASDIARTVASYQLLADKVDYPFHIGISEAGMPFAGTIKSAAGLGILLYKGLGDTIRVSLTGDPVREIPVAYEILKAMMRRNETPEIISCPTCGRCEIKLEELVRKVESLTKNMKKDIKIAVMGCVVNGPGEARDADLGIGLLFKRGKIVKKVKESELLMELKKELNQFD
jgi:(E)-4-hydroxy-3-methylbut-2-enyl-diphosphate synthase